jgi:hypothetical protein
LTVLILSSWLIASAIFSSAVAISAAPVLAVAAIATVRSSMTIVRSSCGSSWSGSKDATIRQGPSTRMV